MDEETFTVPFSDPAAEPEADFWDEDDTFEDFAEESEEPGDVVDNPVDNDAEDVETVDEPGQTGDPERERIIHAEVARQVDAFIAAQYGHLTNPYTGRAITTKAEFDNYQQSYAEEEQRRKLEDMGISQEALDAAVNNHPAIKQAQAFVQRQQQADANQLLQREFAALQQEFPDCGLTDARELLQTAEGQKALRVWKATELSLADAYAVTHREQLQQRQAAAVKQGVLNQMNGKRHLQQTRGGGERTELPAEIRAEYKKYFPKATDAEIQAMYRKNYE